MSEITIPSRFLVRGGTAAAITALNEIPKFRELVFETDTRNFKFGDGSSNWASLPYALPPFAAASGTDTITCTFTSKPVLFDGLRVYVRAAGANTTTATFNPNSLGALAIKKLGGTALAAGDIAAAGHVLCLVYRSSSTIWELINPALTSIAAGSVTEAMQVLADVTTHNASTSMHGYLKKLSNVSSEYMDGSGAWSVPAGGGGAGNLSHVVTATVAGAAATTLSVSGLDLAADQHYYVVLSIANATGSNADLSLYYNADTTATNYYNQFFSANNTTLAGSRANSAAYATLNASSHHETQIWISPGQDGRARAVITTNRHAASAVQLVIDAHIWDSATNPTGVTISSSVASALAIGSFINVYKVEP